MILFEIHFFSELSPDIVVFVMHQHHKHDKNNKPAGSSA